MSDVIQLKRAVIEDMVVQKFTERTKSMSDAELVRVFEELMGHQAPTLIVPKQALPDIKQEAIPQVVLPEEDLPESKEEDIPEPTFTVRQVQRDQSDTMLLRNGLAVGLGGLGSSILAWSLATKFGSSQKPESPSDSPQQASSSSSDAAPVPPSPPPPLPTQDTRDTSGGVLWVRKGKQEEEEEGQQDLWRMPLDDLKSMEKEPEKPRLRSARRTFNPLDNAEFDKSRM